MGYEFKSIENTDFDVLTDTWNLAFSDYVVPVNITQETLKAYFKVSGVDKRQSFGAYQGDELVGLLINSVDTYDGRIVAYDAMTGIVPEHRGRGLFTQLFEHTRNSLKKSGINLYYLEVITENKKAFSIYQRKGGEIEREFSFLIGSVDPDCRTSAEVKTIPLVDYPPSSFKNGELSYYKPSFGNRTQALLRNADDYRVAGAETGGGKAAAVYSCSRGRVMQIMYGGKDDNESLLAVMSFLSENCQEFQVSNIPITESGLIQELLRIGFRVSVNQYEMCIEL
jgi:ribosomal protein S18 acetylase RimI-like enzyme